MKIIVEKEDSQYVLRDDDAFVYGRYAKKNEADEAAKSWNTYYGGVKPPDVPEHCDWRSRIEEALSRHRELSRILEQETISEGNVVEAGSTPDSSEL